MDFLTTEELEVARQNDAKWLAILGLTVCLGLIFTAAAVYGAAAAVIAACTGFGMLMFAVGIDAAQPR